MKHEEIRRGLCDAVYDLKGYLLYLKGLGFEGLPLCEQALSVPDQPKEIPVVENLDTIRHELGDCRRCKLHKGRKHIVFGEGNPQARLVFVGEGPGHDEDVQGLPFVGRAGQLLTKIIQSIDLTREDVYICNIIKCRPPGNRNPERDEIEACLPFLQRQLKAIEPEFICALGTFAAQTLLQTKTPISKLRGTFHAYEGIRLLPTYHPAFLLRNPNKKRDVWEDVQKLQAAYNER
jgi:DNA polymerase